MRSISTKRAKANAAARLERANFLLEFPRCMVPWCRAASCDVHEIARGSSRARAINRRIAWLALCRKCHDQFADASLWPVDMQLALKAMWDADYLDVPGVNELRGRAVNAIDTRDMVLATLKLVRRAVLQGWSPSHELW
jgi:hypothetical protein